MSNIFLMTPDETIELPNFQTVCDICGQVFEFPVVTVRPTMVYKIHQGLLLRLVDFVEPVSQNCGHYDLIQTWIFSKPSQEMVTLQQIIDLQNVHLDPRHVVNKLTNPASTPA